MLWGNKGLVWWGDKGSSDTCVVMLVGLDNKGLVGHVYVLVLVEGVIKAPCWPCLCAGVCMVK